MSKLICIEADEPKDVVAEINSIAGAKTVSVINRGHRVLAFIEVPEGYKKEVVSAAPRRPKAALEYEAREAARKKAEAEAEANAPKSDIKLESDPKSPGSSSRPGPVVEAEEKPAIAKKTTKKTSSRK